MILGVYCSPKFFLPRFFHDLSRPWRPRKGSPPAISIVRIKIRAAAIPPECFPERDKVFWRWRIGSQFCVVHKALNGAMSIRETTGEDTKLITREHTSGATCEVNTLCHSSNDF
jgi:hypothetical protein